MIRYHPASRAAAAPAGRSAHRALALAALLFTVQGLAAPAARADDSDARADRACAAMGEGFTRVPGSKTCVQVSSSVGVTVGSGRVPGNAPNQGFSTTPTPPPATDAWQRTR